MDDWVEKKLHDFDNRKSSITETRMKIISKANL